MTAEIKKSFCHLCLAECGITVTIDNNQIIKISPDPTDKVSQGYICEKAQMLINYQRSKDRISSPLKKVNDKFIEISWEQAFDEITEKLKVLDHDSILYMAPVPGTFQSNNIYGYELATKLGAKYMTNVFSVEKVYNLLAQMYLYDTGIVSDRKNTQTLILLGQNTWVTQHYPRARIILNEIKKNPNRKLIVIDPCETETTKIADLHLKLTPGTDAWLLTALIKILIDNSWIDDQYINDYTIHVDKIKQHFNKVDVNQCSTICGIDIEQLYQVADIIHNSQGFILDDGLGICHGPSPQTSNYLINLLYLLTGNINTIGGALNYGMVQLGTGSYYFNEKYTPITKQRQIEGAMPGGSVADDLEYMDCVIINNTNPVNRLPNSKKIIENLAKVNLVIAMDSFMTGSTKVADYILPTPTFFERTECINTTHPIENTIQISRPILTNSLARPANDIFESLIERLNLFPNIDSWILLYKENETEFYQRLEQKFNDKDADIYYILKRTVGTRFKHYIVSVWWWALYLKTHDKNIVDTIINELDANDVVTLPIEQKEITDKIDLAPIQLLSSLKLFTSRLSSPGYEYILQSGHRKKSAVNTIINNNDPLQLEVYREDADRLSIVDNEIINLETPLINVEIECKIVDNSQQGILRLTNAEQINFFTDEKSIDYLNPRYKFVFANIRKIT